MSHKNVEGTITQLNNNNIGACYAHFCPQCALHYDKKKKKKKEKSLAYVTYISLKYCKL